MCHLENLYDIKFSYVDGELKKGDKETYFKQTGKKLTDFYEQAEYFRYVISEDGI